MPEYNVGDNVGVSGQHACMEGMIVDKVQIEGQWQYQVEITNGQRYGGEGLFTYPGYVVFVSGLALDKLPELCYN